MPRYTTTIDATWGNERAFAFMSDFANARVWDPSVVAADRTEDGDIRVGSAFDLTVSVGRRRTRLRYAVVEIAAPHRVVFAAATGRLISIDTLTFEPHAAGCRMTYDATLRLTGAAAIANPIIGLACRRLGDRARDSLRSILSEP